MTSNMIALICIALVLCAMVLGIMEYLIAAWVLVAASIALLVYAKVYMK